MTNGAAFYNEFLSTALLVLVILAITDKKNARLPPSLDPLALFIAILGIAACLGMETGFSLNPARDFGPRIMTAMAGYGTEVFNYRG
jgi:aquaglyceroporin related protein, other eukaryote